MYGVNWQSEQWERERARAIRTKRNATMRPTAPIPTPTTPQADLSRLLPSIPIPTGPRHTAFWSWLASVPRGIKPSARVEIWPRGGAKSTCAELAAVWTALTLRRSFVLYVSGTQAQADMHLQTVSAYLERCGIRRAVNAYNASRGWTAQMLRTEHGWNALSVGLDGPIRGAKLDELRPDLIVLDDIDARHDSQALTVKKLRTITQTILPAGSPDAAVLFVQNKIHADSCIARVWDGRADVLLDRDGTCEPAIDGLVTERRDGRYVIVSGVPTWADGQGLDVCQAQMNEWGLSAFLSESQHDTRSDDGMFGHLDYRHCSFADLPDLVRVVVWCDPAVTATDHSDSNGIQVDGVAADGTIYRLYSWEQRSTPEATIRQALLKAVEYKAEHIGIETDQGGETWRSVVVVAWQSLVESADHPHITAEMERPRVKSAKAGSIGPKAHRASQMLAAYERGEIVHVIGTHHTLEAALNRFPKTKPYDLTDAAYWAWRDLAKGGVSLL